MSTNNSFSRIKFLSNCF